MRKFFQLSLSLLVVLLLFSGAQTPPAVAAEAMSCAYKNPLVAKGQDPSVVYRDGFYYMVQSDAGGLQLKKSATLTGFSSAKNISIWTPPPGQPYSFDLWAPELVYLADQWIIYFAADDAPGHNAAHRMFALRADSPDPTGTWTFKGKVYQDAATDKWAIDASVFTLKDRLYMVWSGWPTDIGDFPQVLYIAPMIDPFTVRERHMISVPDQGWEKSVAAINEGPEPFIHNGQLSIVYSSDASWTPAYKLGLLKLTGADPLDPAAWTKSGPVFQKTADLFGPGHNSAPVASPDGTQDWLVYHANTPTSGGWENRQIQMQPFTWNADNTPAFGTPLSPTAAAAIPSGQPCGLLASYSLDDAANVADANGAAVTVNGAPVSVPGHSGAALRLNGTADYIDPARPVLSTLGSYSVAAWVQLDRLDGTFSILSQEGGIASEFALQYDATAGFSFTLFNWKGDVDARAAAQSPAIVGAWVHLTGVRDALKGEIRLYVNGKLESAVPYNADWDARGRTIIGAARRANKRTEWFAGVIDEVRLFNSALTDAQAAGVYLE